MSFLSIMNVCVREIGYILKCNVLGFTKNVKRSIKSRIHGEEKKRKEPKNLTSNLSLYLIQI